MDGKLLTIKREVTSWSGVQEERDASGTVALRYGEHELGRLDLADGTADLPVPQEIHDDLLLEGQAKPHRAGSEDLEFLGANYDRARGAAGEERNLP